MPIAIEVFNQKGYQTGTIIKNDILKIMKENKDKAYCADDFVNILKYSYNQIQTALRDLKRKDLFEFKWITENYKRKIYYHLKEIKEK